MIKIALEIKQKCKTCKGMGFTNRKTVQWAGKVIVEIDCPDCNGTKYYYEKQMVSLAQFKKLLEKKERKHDD